ncbi:hypothetical protein CAI21_15755 [Alkalilimnicola ehrlichii]|uniref:Outer membrane protein beta-barrel domain-containing protein n=1 Tax=Alkalilimnicola ehrlichii TaxID=351052 RepID=A0A3E0WQ34_9GAMM|nr:hypothetical protein [Alkalilimnicola ehrlichii]RFA27006.1 hypothetical protein CAI21_15755 [Alkalilimnicola ehrlichii]RFA34127.1 hypothetical protein CAL65_15890 [Alkalilimnicola ehrlichii]
MPKAVTVSLALLLVLAADSTAAACRSATAGGGLYYSMLNPFARFFGQEPESHRGAHVKGTCAFNNVLALRASYFWAEHSDANNWAHGVDGSVLLGRALARPGFTAHMRLGGGYTQNRLQSSERPTYRVGYFGFGVGYNWEQFGLEFAHTLPILSDTLSREDENHDEDLHIPWAFKLSALYRF